MALLEYSLDVSSGGVTSIPQDTWNHLAGAHAPHLSHEFLAALETHRCLGDRVGWHPSPWLVKNPASAIVAALPLYVKDNSFGEFVFDWAWAEAYQRHGMPYYPKWVVASPFTPATANKFLSAAITPEPEFHRILLQGVIESAEEQGISSVHFLFTNEAVLRDAELIHRIGCQFHWKNQGYRDFRDFLETLTAKRRKEILRERRKVKEAGIAIQRRSGGELSANDWMRFHELYRSTFEKHANFPALTLGFFQSIGKTMGDKLLLIEALSANQVVASAFFMVGENTLYGRYWGAIEEVPTLHFEVCYYQGIEFAIEKGLLVFEPGAQGEHKISRGFLPVKTHSYHWIGHEGFRDAIARHVILENRQMQTYIRNCNERSPYRSESC
ncbi:MAG: hypothetical protein RLZ25_1752 [Pseudomonadota bacterium]